MLTQERTASCPDVKYFRVLLDQFLTNDIIGSCALAKILDVKIVSEIPRRQSLVTRKKRKKKSRKFCSFLEGSTLGLLPKNWKCSPFLFFRNTEAIKKCFET